MENNNDMGFLLEPPAALDSRVFAKVAPVLKENRQIHRNKRWFQVWMPAASTVALTAFGFWFLNKKSNQILDTGIPVGAIVTEEMDLQSFATLEMDEENLDLANNLEVIEDLDLLESYDDENS